MNEINKIYLIKARNICNISRFIDDGHSINNGGNLNLIIVISKPSTYGLVEKMQTKTRLVFWVLISKLGI